MVSLVLTARLDLMVTPEQQVNQALLVKTVVQGHKEPQGLRVSGDHRVPLVLLEPQEVLAQQARLVIQVSLVQQGRKVPQELMETLVHRGQQDRRELPGTQGLTEPQGPPDPRVRPASQGL